MENPPRKEMLFTEGFLVFQRHWLEWLKLAMVFFVAMLAINIIAMSSLKDSLAALQKVSTISGKPDPEVMKAMWSGVNGIGLLLYGIVLAVVGTAQYYLFLSFYSRQENIAATLAPSVNGYFYAYWKTFQAGLMIISPLMAMGIVAGVVVAVGAAGQGKSGMGMLGTLWAVGALGATLYMAIKYALVMTLAVNDIRPTLKISWHMTDGNWWRILGNGLLFAMVVGIGYGIVNAIISLAIGAPIGILAIATHAKPTQISGAPFYLSLLFSALLSLIMSGLQSAYAVGCVRILRDEQKLG